jgi:hypothetical protein
MMRKKCTGGRTGKARGKQKRVYDPFSDDPTPLAIRRCRRNYLTLLYYNVYYVFCHPYYCIDDIILISSI